jgi:hypothetical protein
MEPSMKNLNNKYHSFCQPSNLVWARKILHQQLMSAHKLALLTFAFPLGKIPIFPQIVTKPIKWHLNALLHFLFAPKKLF